MSDKAFFDTNLAIAWVFHMNSLHNKSKDAFNNYSTIHWSSFVKKEYENRYDEKLANLLNFFEDLKLELDNPTKELYSIQFLLHFVEKYGGESQRDITSSLYPFWNYYCGIETQIPFLNFKNNISDCLTDLTINVEKRALDLEKIMNLTPKRTKTYANIDAMLKNHGVNDADRNVTLDGHDFACYSKDPVDFVTFDEGCYNGACNVAILCFSSIKGKDDFKAS